MLSSALGWSGLEVNTGRLGCPSSLLSHVTTDLLEFQETDHSPDRCLGTLPKPSGPIQGSNGRLRTLGLCSPKTVGLGHKLPKERSPTLPHPEIYQSCCMPAGYLEGLRGGGGRAGSSSPLSTLPHLSVCLSVCLSVS